MNHRFVEVTTDGSVATITLDRPERHNSLVPELLGELLAAFVAVANLPEIRAVVFAANGRSFSTGGDIGEFYSHRHELEVYADRIVGLLNEAILTMLRSRLPIVAAVHGMVTGGSLGLVLASDVVLVAREASFTPWYTVVGFSPDGGWTAMLPAAIGSNRAKAVLLENRTISAAEAVDWGLANRVVAPENLVQQAHRAATAMADHRPLATASAKRLAHGDLDQVTARLEAERAAFVAQILTAEARKGMEHFLGVAAR